MVVQSAGVALAARLSTLGRGRCAGLLQRILSALVMQLTVVIAAGI